MAFRKRNTNIVSPLLPDNSTWTSSCAKPTGSVGATAAADDKENLPSEIFGSFRQHNSFERVTCDRLDWEPWTADLQGADRLQTASSNHAVNFPELSRTAPSLIARSSSKFPPTVPLQALRSADKEPFVKMELLGRSARTTSLPPAPKNLRPFVDALRTNLHENITDAGKLPVANVSKLPASSQPVTASLDNLDVLGQGDHEVDLQEYGRLLREVASKNSAAAAKQAEKILRGMIKRYYTSQSQIRPDGACFNTVIHAYAELGDATSAEAILMLMFQEFQDGNHLAEPNARVYTNVLHAWRKSKDPSAPERCEKILETMHRLYQSGALPNCKPDTFSYTVLFHCWAESNRDDAAQNAERLFRTMKHRFLHGQEVLRPDAIAYSNLLNIFTKDNATHERAEDLLWEMVDDYVAGNESAKPRIRNFNTVLAMWSKSKTNEAPYRAQSIVVRLIKMNDGGLIDVKPDVYTYSLLLKAWVATQSADGIAQAVKCLYWMQDMYHRGDEAACLDVIKYTTCISALAKKGQPDQAESLLNKMSADYLGGNEKARPDSKIYDIVINSWTGGFGSNENIDAERAESLLRHMWKLSSSHMFNHMRPSAAMYRRVITAMALMKRPQRAEALLFEMERLQKTGKLNESPSIQAFQTVINAWDESDQTDAKMRAYKLRLKMNQRFSQHGFLSED